MSDRCQVLGRRGPLSRRLSWWPWLIGPCAAGLLAGVGVLGSVRPEVMRVISGPAQRYSEAIAPFLLAVAVAVYVVNAVVTRNPLSMVLVALSVSLFCREIHFEWTHRGVYVMLAATGIWALAWRRKLRRPIRNFRHTSWLLATLWTYLLAFLISRRVFRFVPGERAVHSFLEEGMETVSHLMLIATSLLASWRRHRWTRSTK
ncbi:MAG: hypothetical protein WBF17_15990 [Phycisphaerae bacterium]